MIRKATEIDLYKVFLKSQLRYDRFVEMSKAELLDIAGNWVMGS